MKMMTWVDSTGGDHSDQRRGQRRWRGSACSGDGERLRLDRLNATQTGEEAMAKLAGGTRRLGKDEGDRGEEEAAVALRASAKLTLWRWIDDTEEG